MAIEAVKPDSDLIISLATGVSADGKTTYTTKTISQLNPDCTDSDAHAVGAAIAALQSHDVGAIKKRTTVTLQETTTT